jgi:TatD DNase family protein
MKLFDAHNHLQDERLRPREPDIVAAAQQAGVVKMVVNGSCEEDWGDVLELGKTYPALVIPSFGVHPWYISERSENWQSKLIRMLDSIPSAVGEIGLDKWILEPAKPVATTFTPASIELQEEVFVFHLRLAAARNVPASIHCLKAWGRLLEVLKHESKPECGFVLHSFGGPKEMIQPLADLGAYFSLPGYFAHERKGRQREAFRHVPLDRLLIETDAPDQSLPEGRTKFPLQDAEGKIINHPANLIAVYELAAEIVGRPLPDVAEIVETNFNRLFGPLL